MENNEKNRDVWSFRPSDLYTVPNILTYIRLILIIPFCVFFIREQYIPAAVCIAFSGLSDCLDGLLARKLNQITPLGKILDPIADKLTLLAVAVCMAIYVPVVLPVMIILLLKDLIMLIGGTVLIKKGITPPAAKWYGKVGTIVFYVSVCLIIFLKAVFKIEILELDIVLLTITAAVMIFALCNYGKLFFSMLKEQKNGSNDKNPKNNEKIDK